MEILKEHQYEEYDNFVSKHYQSAFTQSINWHNVKSNWGFETVVSRNSKGEIVGAVGILIQKIPFLKSTLLYAPRGPVCDLHDLEVLADLKRGVDQVAKKHNAHTFKCDPDVLIADEETKQNFKALGFQHTARKNPYKSVQSRYNYRLNISGKTCDELLKHFSQKTRYNIKVALKHGLEVKAVGVEYLDDFMRLMEATGHRDGFNIRPKSYFERMLKELKDNVRLYMAFYNDIPISAAITTNYGDKTCYVYGASGNEYRNLMPNYLMQWEMIKWAVEKNCNIYDFQGVLEFTNTKSPLYGVYRFKKGFNGTLDELIGEFDYCYKPFTAGIVAIGINLKKFWHKIKVKKISKDRKS